MRVFKTKWFTGFARHEGITDEKLLEAVHEAERGNVDADLGGGLIKQRIAREGGGKSGGYRVIIVYKAGATCFFLYGFAKSDRGNIEKDELKMYKILAKAYSAYGKAEIEKMLQAKEAVEVTYR